MAHGSVISNYFSKVIQLGYLELATILTMIRKLITRCIFVTLGAIFFKTYNRS